MYSGKKLQTEGCLEAIDESGDSIETGFGMRIRSQKRPRIFYCPGRQRDLLARLFPAV